MKDNIQEMTRRVQLMEYLLSDLKIPTPRGPIEASLLIGGAETRLGTSTVLKQIPEKVDRHIIECDGAILLPSLHDSLSWIEDNVRQSDIRRLIQMMGKGGVTSTSVAVDKPVSRVKWLDIGRKLAQVAGVDFTFYGPESYVRRWRHKEGGELPKLRVLMAPEQLRESTSVQVCHAQEHRLEHVVDDVPVVRLWWTEREIDLEELREPLSQDFINHKLCNEVVEKKKIEMCRGKDVLIVGATTEYIGAPHLVSIIPPKTVVELRREKLVGTPLRSIREQRELVRRMMESEEPFLIAVGHTGREGEDDWVTPGVNIMDRSLPSIFSTLSREGYSYEQIYKRVLTSVMFHHQKLNVSFPDEFALLKKPRGGSHEVVLTYNGALLFDVLS